MFSCPLESFLSFLIFRELCGFIWVLKVWQYSWCDPIMLILKHFSKWNCFHHPPPLSPTCVCRHRELGRHVASLLPWIPLRTGMWVEIKQWWLVFWVFLPITICSSQWRLLKRLQVTELETWWLNHHCYWNAKCWPSFAVVLMPFISLKWS